MKRVLLLALCLAMFSGCVPKTDPATEEVSPAPELSLEDFKFTEENFPRIDGSTATIPLIEAVQCAILGKERDQVSVTVSKTSGAYIALAENRADILLVYDGGEETRIAVSSALSTVSSETDIALPQEIVVFDELFETVPIGKDALVFVVNMDNPVENLTTEQVQKIFSGEYRNWSELGGSDEPIRAYQRGIGSGSQALMDKLVMDNLEMADPAKVPVIGGMGELIEAVSNFAGGPSGIGYNVYFYVTEMRDNDYIKILSIDGVTPSYDTIQSGEYPFVSEFYSVIRKDEPEDSPARILHEWMLTEQAQNLMVSENYVALHANPNADTPYVDGEFSVYPQGEEPVYLEDVNLYSLEAGDDYGQLYFYMGSRRYDDYLAPDFYGLCTEDGKIVTKPIYTIPRLLTDSKGNNAYLCYRADRVPAIETVGEGEWSYENNIYPVLLFATDGSWIKEFDSAKLCMGFAGASFIEMNSDFLAVMLGDKWGAVNMKGETVLPFERDSYVGIYPQSPENYFDAYPGLGVTGDRFMHGGHEEDGKMVYDLYDGNQNLIGTGLHGMPTRMSGTYIVTNEWDNGATVYTYTMEGKLIASRSGSSQNKYSYAAAMGEYVYIIAEKSKLICDRELNILYEYEDDEQSGSHNSLFYKGENVLYSADPEALLHRTYLPDGTRLVTWYDPEMGKSPY